MASSALNLRKPVEQPLWGELYSELTTIVYPFFTGGKARSGSRSANLLANDSFG